MSSGRSLHSASILTSSFKFQILDNKFLNCDTTTMTNKYHLVDPHIQPLNVHLSILSSGGIIGEIQICKMSHFYTEQLFQTNWLGVNKTFVGGTKSSFAGW